MLKRKEENITNSEIHVDYEVQIPLNYIIKSFTREFLEFEQHNSSLLKANKFEFDLLLWRQLRLFPPSIDFDNNLVKFDGSIVLNTATDSAWIPIESHKFVSLIM